MKTILKTIIIVAVIFLICLVVKLDILDFSAFKVDEQKLLSYSGFYYNQLQQDEKEIYIKIDDAVKNIRKTVYLGTIKTNGLSDKIGNVISAYFYDNPEIHYLSNEYMVSTRDLKIVQFSTLELIYTVNSNDELIEQNKQLNLAINKIIKDNITDNMSDFEKELAIHDALVRQISYYDYENIQDIPSIKHTAYGALVQNEAVCDGYSKAFKILLEKVGIECIIISGSSENVAHAWNVVNIQDEYYHVDVTSDKLDKSGKHIIHVYFNISDEQISTTHTINDNYNIPKCNFENYNYYNKKGYYVAEKDNLYNKLGEIITNQRTSSILEIRIDPKYSSKRLIDTLYDLDFNNWRSSMKNRVEYTKVQDKYIFVK